MTLENNYRSVGQLPNCQSCGQPVPVDELDDAQHCTECFICMACGSRARGSAELKPRRRCAECVGRSQICPDCLKWRIISIGASICQDCVGNRKGCESCGTHPTDADPIDGGHCKNCFRCDVCRSLTSPADLSDIDPVVAGRCAACQENRRCNECHRWHDLPGEENLCADCCHTCDDCGVLLDQKRTPKSRYCPSCGVSRATTEADEARQTSDIEKSISPLEIGMTVLFLGWVVIEVVSLVLQGLF
jgi:hypothetical protein